MQSSPTQDNQPPAEPPEAPGEPNRDVTKPPTPIRDLAGREDFPQCTVGAYIDIQGFAGVVLEIVKGSLKVRSPEGITQRFNAGRLKTLYGPPPPFDPPPTRETVEERPMGRTSPSSESKGDDNETEEPAREYIANPDFTIPVRPISLYAREREFPKNSYGQHVDIQGYQGIVIEIVRGSLKVQTSEGMTRSYNADVLKKVHGRG